MIATSIKTTDPIKYMKGEAKNDKPAPRMSASLAFPFYTFCYVYKYFISL